VASEPIADRPNQALLVIDVQNDVVVNAPARDSVVGKINTLVGGARTAGVPVVWVQHNDDGLPYGEPGWQIVDELTPLDDEIIVHKNFRDSFEQTNLEEVLAEQGIGRLVVTGAQSDYCVRWTLHGAHTRGYDTTLVADAHCTDDAPTDALPSATQTVGLLNNVWATQVAPGRAATVKTTAEIDW